MIVCDDCRQTTAGRCWRHAGTGSSIPIPPSRAAQEKPTSPPGWTAHDYITRAYERTASLDSMIDRLHEYGYEIRPIEREAAAATPSLDVERLARAIEAFSVRIGDGGKVILWRGAEEQDAELIAAEYACLDEGSATPDPDR